MTTIAIILAFTLVFLAVTQAIPGLWFARLLFRPKPELLEDRQCPKAAVLLAVRGNDPFLGDCVEAILQQDYPNYELRIVVDHPEDPAWQVISEVVERMKAPNVSMEYLRERLGTCTLKSNSLLQAVAGLDDSIDAIAILDSDTVTHPTWLRELVAPLTDDQVGVASGNRWYMPIKPTMGSLVRYIWNAAAVVQMYYNRFTWGGSVAIRGDIVRHSRLQERWRHAVASDTAIYGVVRESGKRAAFVPSLMIINRESCRLGEFFEWMKRQLMVGRLQHGGWRMVFLHGMINTFALTATIIVIAAAIYSGNSVAFGWASLGIAFYALAMISLLVVLELGVRKTATDRGQPTQWLSLATLAKFTIALPLTQILYSMALPMIRSMRDVTWRGVSYRIDGPWKITLTRYQPFQSKKRKEDAQVSL
jgi:cellulose synthase/poly-beta-1,6-N-acetylglucosamine synthase-like glycosyltransferase